LSTTKHTKITKGLSIGSHFVPFVVIFSLQQGRCGFPRGRKRGGLRNKREMVGTGRDSWRTDTMGLGGGPQGSNLFPQAGRLTSSREIKLVYHEEHEDHEVF
jgi:hypothetical protein